MTPRTNARIGRLLGYEGALATVALTVFEYFLVSVSFIAALVPALAFQALIGWQATHLALWSGALSLVLILPAAQALCVASAALLEHGASSRAARVYWHAFAAAVRTRLGAALLVPSGVLLLGYDVALLGADGAVLLGAVLIGAAGAVVLLASAFAVADGADARGVPLLIGSARLLARRPHLALVWILLGALAALVTSLPVVGAIAWMSAPALAGVAASVCNRELGFRSARDRVLA